MKRHKVLFLVSQILFGLYCFGQSEKPKCSSNLDSLLNKTVYSVVDKMPEPVGGDIELHRKLVRNLVYRQDSTNTIGSRVYVGFVIDINGKVIGKRIFGNIEGTDLAQQALALVDKVEWNSGMCDGEKVPVLYKLPITICLK
jgi:hypothetical protein